MPFAPVTLSEREEALRAEVRDFLAAELPRGSYRPGLGMNADASPDFSRKLAARGWVGMTIPQEYGGHGRGPVERFIVVEELLAAGAPVGAHWIADRRTAPTLMAFGSEAQQRRFLPAIAAGECYFSLGMSEPDAGSDLAAGRNLAGEPRDRLVADAVTLPDDRVAPAPSGTGAGRLWPRIATGLTGGAGA